MDQSLEVSNIKIEPTDSTTSDRQEISTEMQMESIKQESNCFSQSEVYIKTELQEDENEFPVITSTSHGVCISSDINSEIYEPIVKIEFKDMPDEIMQDPLDIDGERKAKERFPIDLDQSESGINTKSNEGQNKEHLLETDKNNLHGSESNQNEGQLLFGNGSNRKYKTYICNECNKTFRGKCDLDRHLRVHTGEKPFTCIVCEKSYKQKGILDRHMLIHSGEKPYICSVCEKDFVGKSNLNNHMLIHSDEKAFSCDECDKKFTQKYLLIRHKRMHTGYKPYTCDLCNKAFKHSSALTRHIRIHTEDKPHSCEICNKSFTRKDGLNYHKRTQNH